MNAMILLAQGAMNMADSLATANPVRKAKAKQKYC